MKKVFIKLILSVQNKEKDLYKKKNKKKCTKALHLYLWERVVVYLCAIIP